LVAGNKSNSSTFGSAPLDEPSALDRSLVKTKPEDEPPDGLAGLMSEEAAVLATLRGRLDQR